VRDITPETARKKLNEQGFQLNHPVGENDFTMVFTGGSTWVNYAYKAVKATLESRKLNWKTTQIIIICGNNKDAFKQYSELAKQFSDRKLHVLPFMNYEQMALVYRSANLVTLASIAPATLNELLEVGNAPIVIHHNNPGQEKANLQFALDNKLVEHIPHKRRFVKFVVRMQKDRKFTEQIDQSFRQRAQATREVVRNNSIKTANFILSLLNR
jgi:UDP-N-acetylglucosamine:LPS N-acetylglucosamine transferase